MKKIGLAACHDALNFGSQLQLVANAKAIEDLGYKVELICYKKVITPKFLLQTIPRLFNYRFVKSKLSSRIERIFKSKDEKLLEISNIRKKRFNQFAEQFFPSKSITYAGWETLVRESKKNYDGFVCGSDQLWLPNNLGSHFFTLEFAPNDKPKIAYATSFGVSEIPWFQTKKTAKYLNRFQALSTREMAGQQIIQKLTGKSARVVCDPTLLYNADAWKKIIPEKKIVRQPYAFAYLLGDNPEHRDIAIQAAKELGVDLVTCPFMDSYLEFDKDFGDIQMLDVGTEDFINLIRHADYVLTDSFHGTVFSILHHKKFLTFNRFKGGSNSRNSRIDSLCTLLDLSDRRYAGDWHVIEDEIDYALVEEKLTDFRRGSMEYLGNALSLV